MRLVVDTNVFVSAALKASSWPASVVRWVDRHGRLLKTATTEAEVIEVLLRPSIAGKIAPFYLEGVRRILESAELVKIVEPIIACRDPADDKFLELAVNGHADMIVTGDRDLLVLNPFRGIRILGPAAFVEGVAGSQD